MITHISIEGFKSLKKVELELGNLNIFIGANASGKSNFFDALRVLQGIGYGFTIDEIFNGKPKGATSEVWEGIRGGTARADFISKVRPEYVGQNAGRLVPEWRTMKFEITLRDQSATVIDYAIEISTQRATVVNEKLCIDSRVLYDSVQNSNEQTNYPDSPSITLRYYPAGDVEILDLQNHRPVLHQLSRHPLCTANDRSAIDACVQALSDMQRLDPAPAVLREYSRAIHVTRLGEHGENFAPMVENILVDEGTKSAYLSWLQQLTPLEFDDVKVLKGELGEPLSFALVEQGATYPAQVLSDGTLRFAAIVAAFFQTDMPSILTIEEVENGLHPSRLRLLVELLKSRARENCQVMITSHSPVLLSWLSEEDYRTTFLCYRNDETGASEIVPLSGIPNFLELSRTESVMDLLTEGWLEKAL